MQQIRDVLLDKQGLKSELEALKNGRMFFYEADPLMISYRNTVNNNDVFEIFIDRDDLGDIEGTILVEGGLASILNVTKPKDVVDKLRAGPLRYYATGVEVANAIPANGGRRRKYTKKARKTRRRSRKHRS